MNGFLVLDKPKGFTSFDAVAKLRKLSGEKKIGHGGTLDPEVTGVLPVFFGNATKAIALLPESDKTYEAVMLLGTVTDTDDDTGRVIGVSDVNVSEEDVKNVILSFLGEYDQIPPMLSAKWVNGQRLYDLFRKGREIEREPVRVMIRSITVNSIDLPEVTFTVEASKGTYIRTLCRDIGEKLGVGGTLKRLKRTVHGRFGINSAVSLDTLEEAAKNGLFEDYVTPTDRLFFDHPELTVSEEGDKYLLNGNTLVPEDFNAETEMIPGTEYRVYRPNGVFFALYRVSDDGGALKPEKIFPEYRE